MKTFHYALLCAALMLLASASRAFAWPGGPPAKVVLRGPHIQGEVVVTLPEVLEGLGAEQFIDWNQSSTVQPFIADGYELVRYYRDGGDYWALDRVRYYPNPNGGRGAILYVGGVDVNTGGGIWNGRWFDATAAGDAGMARLLKYVATGYAPTPNAASESKPSNEQSPRPSATPSNGDTPVALPFMLAALGLSVVTLALGVWLGKRARTP